MLNDLPKSNAQPKRDDIILALDEAPISVQANINKILQTLNLQDSSILQKLDKLIPFLDFKDLRYPALVMVFILSNYIGLKWESEESMYHNFYTFIDQYTPEWLELTLNSIHTRMWIEYWNGAVLWAIATSALATLGVLWFKDVKFSKKEQQEIDEGVHPYNWAWHTVWIGMRDNLSYWNIDQDKTSFLKALKKKWDIVLIQESGPAWHPSVLRTSTNKRGIYANMKNLGEEGVEMPDNYLPAIVSGLYNAKNLIINDKDVPLFSDHVVNNYTQDHNGINLMAAKHIVENAMDIGRKVHGKDKSLMNIALVAAKYTRLGSYEYEEDIDPLDVAITTMFNKSWEDYHLSYITREDVFVEMLVDSIKEKGLEQRKIYIDVDWNEEIGERCKEMIQGALGCDESHITFSPGELKEIQDDMICVLIRDDENLMATLSRHNIDHLKMTHVFSPKSLRSDSMTHKNKKKDWKRIPIDYNSEVWRRLLKFLD